MKALFQNVPDKDLFGLQKAGKYDFKKASELLGLSRRDISKAAGVSEQSVRYDDRMPDDLEKFFMELISVLALVSKQFENDQSKTITWFKMPNPMLGGVSPVQMLCLGKFKKLMLFITKSIEGDIP